MRTASDKGISLLDNCVHKTARPLPTFTNHIYLAPKQRTDLRLLDLANTHDLTLLHKFGNGQPHRMQAMLKLHNQELIELLRQLISYPIKTPSPPWYDERRLEQCRNINLTSCSTLSHLLMEIRNTCFSESNQRVTLSGYTGLMDVHLERPFNNVIYLDRYTDADSYISKQQLYDLFTQRHIEIELLKRALFVSRKRLSGTKIKLYKSILKNKKLRQQRRDLKTELEKLLENNKAIRNETAESGMRLSRELSDQDGSQQPLQKQILMDKPVEEMQIINLQQSLMELQDQLAQAREAQNEHDREKNDGLNEAINGAERTVEAIYGEIEQMRQMNDSIEQKLEDNRLQSGKTQEDNNAQLAELQAERQQRGLESQTSLTVANRSASDELTEAEAEAEISALKEQLEAKEKSRQKLQREKAVLANSLQAETSRSLEFVDQVQLQGERIKSLEIKLKATKQAGKEAEARHNNAISAAKEELDQALKSIEGLKETHQKSEERLQQEQADFKILQEKLNQALEAEKQHAKDEQSHFEAKIEALNQQLDETKRQAQADSQSLQEKMKQTLATEKQHAKDEQGRLNSVIEGLNRQLEADRSKADQQLEEARQQARAGSQILLGRMNQALAAEKQQAKQEQTRLESVIEELNQQLRAARAEADRQLDEARQQSQADIQSLQEQMDQAMAQALDTQKQQAREEQTRFEAEIKGLNQQLQVNQAKADRQLDEAQHQAQAEIQALQEQMNQALESEKEHAREEQTRLESVIEELNQQLRDTRAESDRQLDEAQRQAQADVESLQAQMDQTMEQALEAEKQQALKVQNHLTSEIKKLNQQLKVTREEADRQLDEALRNAEADTQSLREQMNQTMAQALEAEKQQAREIQNGLATEIKGLNQQLKANRAEAEKYLAEAQQQAQAESHKLQKQMKQALETEKQNRTEEQARFMAEIESLNEALKSLRTEECKQRDNLIEQEALLEQERKTNNELRDLLNKTEKALSESEKRIAEAERNHQDTLSELQKELASNENAWSKLAETEVEAQTTKQELSSLRIELEQEITNLRAQLELKQQNSDATQRRHKEENEQLQQLLSESQEKVKLADSNIRLLKRDQESQSKAKAQLEDQLAKLQKEAKIKQAELTASIESERQNVESLHQQLKLAKVQNEDPGALQRLKEENILLKRKIKGMHEVQMEMESQMVVDGGDEIRMLHEELIATQTKLKNVEKLAEQSKKLSRENQIHASAIDMLSEDLDAVTEEKESLKEERDGLMKELNKIKKHYSKLARENGRIH